MVILQTEIDQVLDMQQNVISLLTQQERIYPDLMYNVQVLCRVDVLKHKKWKLEIREMAFFCLLSMGV